MINSKWYVLVETEKNVAADYMQLPEVWAGQTGIQNLSDIELANVGAWAGRPGFSLISLQEAREQQVNGLQRILGLRKLTVIQWLRSMRDPLLAASDIVAIADRWSKFDPVSKGRITAFRQALRDITNGDVFDVKWPTIPDELSFIKKIGVTSFDRPSDDFVRMMLRETNEMTREQVIADQWIRIKEERDRRKAGGVSVLVNDQTYWFWTDEPTRNQYSILDSMIRRNGLPPTFVIDNWKTMSGVFIPMTVALLYKVMDGGIQNERILFQIGEEHRIAMEASERPESYDYSGKWPKTYEEYARSL